MSRRPEIGIRNVRTPEVRSKLVAKHAYRIHYLVRSGELVILHIRHTSRRSWPGVE